ncbi:hypothetical protein [Marinobacter zhanjiangensis]|uniref:Uncharacterized protein n=1 Tax=Marinobacter zhanjiangensis TaxID=578215 RepID=A0ABQ3BAQ6_9GAMM|nr:hypothetical protein [Marinobacter zhanjiangensis]GGY82011.1 hypothetical protein GCM10007071_31710 [Marinobacter zhanjiangensis]
MSNEYDEFAHPEPEPVKPEMRFLNLTDPTYLLNKNITDGAYRDIPEKLGKKGDPDIHLAQLVQLEVQMIAPFEIAALCRQYAYMWRKEKNPHCVDLIAMACQQYNFVPPPSVVKVLAEAATLRIEGHPAGTAKRLLAENAKHQAMRLMANLIHSGDTQETAGSKAAQWHHDNFPGLKLKAGTLDQYYRKEYRETGVEGWLFELWSKCPEIKAQWKAIKDKLPLADIDLIGFRR